MKILLLIALLCTSLFSAEIFEMIKENDSLPAEILADTVVLSAKDNLNRTPLMYSAYLGKDTIVKQLLAQKVSVTDSIDSEFHSYGATGVLHWAIHSGKLSTVKLVAEAGAPYYPAGYIRLPQTKEQIESNLPAPYLGSPLNIAAYNTGEEAISIVAYLMEHYSPDIDERERGRNNKFGYTPLMWAIERSNLPMIQEFVTRGADINYIASDGEDTPLCMALYCDDPKILSYLLEKGGNPNIYDNVPRKMTLLQIAAYNNFSFAVEPLLQYGANLDSFRQANVISYRPVAAVPQAPLLAILMKHDSIAEIFLNILNDNDFAKYGTNMAIAAAGIKNFVLLEKIVDREPRILEDTVAAEQIIRQWIHSEETFRNLYSRVTVKLPDPVVVENEEELIIEGIQKLVERGINLSPLFKNDNESHSGETSILISAVDRDFAALLQYLINNGGEVTVEVPYYDNILTYAIYKRYFKAARTLINNGMALTEKEYVSLPQKAMGYDDFRFFYKVLRKSPEYYKNSGKSLLKVAAQNGFTKEMVELLNSGHKHYSVVNEQTDHRRYIYDDALKSGNSKTLKTLFKMYPPTDSVVKSLQGMAISRTGDPYLLTLLNAYSLSDSALIDVFKRCKSGESAEYLLSNYGKLFSDSLKTDVFKRIPVTYGEHNTKRHAIFKSGITLNDSLFYMIASSAVTHSDTVMLKEFVKQKLPLRVPHPRRDEEYSILIELMRKSNDSMIHYYRNNGVELTPEEEYFYFTQVVRSDDTLKVEKLINEGITHENPDPKGIHILRFATQHYAFDVANYLLNHNSYSAETIADGFIGMFKNYSHFWSQDKMNKDRTFQLAERFIALEPDYERFNRSPSPMPSSLNGEFSEKYAPGIYEKGYGINAKDRYGNTAVNNLVRGYNRRNEFQWLEKLIEWGADLNIPNDSGQTPIFKTIHYSDFETATVLLENGADPNIRDIKGDTPLTKYLFAKIPGPLYGETADKRSTKKIKALELLLQYGADAHVVDEKKNSRVITKCYDSSAYMLPILEPYISEDVVNHNGNSFLHVVAEKSYNEETIKKFLAKDLDVNKQNLQGRTPLHLACTNENISVAPFVEAGADLTVLDRSKRGALVEAIKAENVQAVEILVKAGADVNQLDYVGYTPLLHAVRTSLEIITVLKEAGADLNALDKDGNTLLMSALRAGNYNIALALRHWGAQVDVTNKQEVKPVQMISYHVRERKKFEDLCDPQIPLPPIPETSRKPLLGQWWLKEVQYIDSHSNALLNRIEYKKRDAVDTLEINSRLFQNSETYKRVGEEIKLTGRNAYSHAPIHFKDDTITITTEEYDYGVDTYLFVKKVYKKL